MFGARNRSPRKPRRARNEGCSRAECGNAAARGPRPMLLTEDIDRLAAFEPVPFPVLSLYLDARADNTGRDNFDQFLRKAFRHRLRTYRPHSPEHASFSADVERIKRYLANELQPSANGVAIFACAGADGFFEAYQLDAPIDDHRLCRRPAAPVSARPPARPVSPLCGRG